MDSNSSVAIMFVAAFSAAAIIINGILGFRLKSRMIKLGLVDLESIKLLNQLNGNSKLRAFKWALILFFGGIGLMILQIIPYSLNSPLPYGVEAISVAVGLFIYYLLASKRND